ncbi:hypothetical protein B0T09DRAFT_139442 [Sordaria sp. MPI-SDFR-AT-0083]|nr:hypothetical protein B0T09DRAFT_139442 [Sordaria sp. MPI-SDFR-AT-0083]
MEAAMMVILSRLLFLGFFRRVDVGCSCSDGQTKDDRRACALNSWLRRLWDGYKLGKSIQVRKLSHSVLTNENLLKLVRQDRTPPPTKSNPPTHQLPSPHSVPEPTPIRDPSFKHLLKTTDGASNSACWTLASAAGTIDTTSLVWLVSVPSDLSDLMGKKDAGSSTEENQAVSPSSFIKRQ